jgi:hypothetical protein
MKTNLLLITATLLAFLRTAAAQNPIENELFPPDFLMSQRETLGLKEDQLRDIQAMVQDVQPKFETLKGQLEQRAKAFEEALRQAKPDITQTEEKLRAMLGQENEMKLLQMRFMLELRGKLTAEQVDKARELRQQGKAGNNPGDGLPQRLQAKFEKLRSIIEARAAGGNPPEDVVAKAREIQQLVQSGKPLDAEKELDALLSSLQETKSKP